MQRTFIYDDAALCFLQRASGAEIVGEVADLLVRGRGIRRVLCAAIIGDRPRIVRPHATRHRQCRQVAAGDT